MTIYHAPAVVLLDAFGTLVTLDAPAARLHAGLTGRGFEFPQEVVTAALSAEMAYYREHHDRGRDAETLAGLHRECATVLRAGLGGGAPPLPLATDLLLASLRFALLPDALPALDALRDAGCRLAMVSNWDYDLPRVLAELGVADRFEAVVVSAVVGAGKPEPAIFRHALEELRVSSDAAVHCGDRPDRDCLGARRAGIRGVLLDRDGVYPDADCPRIGALTELPSLLERIDHADRDP